jgi:hypothetical protein
MRHSTPVIHRALAIERVRKRLLRESFPRIQMTLIVALTGGFGLLASFLMLKAGLESMAIRYPLALSIAYLFFLFLFWFWLRTKAEDYLDTPDLTGLLPSSRPSAGVPSFKTGSGGDFGGGGATGSFDGPTTTLNAGSSAPLDAIGDSVGSVAEADELAIPLLAIALALGIALASFYVVYLAPILFAEVLVDGVLSYALLRHLRGQEPQHWLLSTFRRTVVPFAATAIFLIAVGAAMASYAPGAKSVGEVVEHARSRPAAT